MIYKKSFDSPSLGGAVLGIPSFALELYGFHNSSTVAADSYVEALNVVEHVSLRLVSAPVRLGRRALGLE